MSREHCQNEHIGLKQKKNTSIDYPDTGFLHIKATDSTVQIKIHSIFFMMLEDTNCIY